MRLGSVAVSKIAVFLASVLGASTAFAHPGGGGGAHFSAPAPHFSAPAPHFSAPSMPHVAPIAPQRPMYHDVPRMQQPIRQQPAQPRVYNIPHGNAPAPHPGPQTINVPHNNAPAPHPGPQTINVPHQGSRPVVSRPLGGHPAPLQAHGVLAVHPVINGSPVRRAEVVNGVNVTRTYTPYTWGGRPYYAYHPYVYSSWYYGYCGAPWAGPVYWQWPWLGSPWYNAYGYYYAPYPAYAAPSFWLTDFLIADMLAEQYALQAQAQAQYSAAVQAQAEAQAAEAQAAQAQAQAAEAQAAQAQASMPQASAPINDDLKEQIRMQVDDEIKAQAAQQPRTIDTAVSDPHHVFAVSEKMSVLPVGSNQPCTVHEGDLLRLKQPIEAGASNGVATVVAAKNGSCPVGTDVNVSVHDLQTFENEFSARVDKGMRQMQRKLPDGTVPPAEQ